MQLYEPAIRIDPKQFLKAESIAKRVRTLQNYVNPFLFMMLGVLVTSFLLGGEVNRAEIAGLVVTVAGIITSLVLARRGRRQATVIFSSIYTIIAAQAVTSFGHDFPIHVLTALDSKEAEPFFATGELNQNIYSAIFDRNNGEIFIRVKPIHSGDQLEVLLRGESAGGKEWEDQASHYLNSTV